MNEFEVTESSRNDGNTVLAAGWISIEANATAKRKRTCV